MSDTPSRMFGLVCVLILIWIGVYWLYEPRSAARPPEVILDPRPATPARAPEPTPPPQPEPTPAAPPPAPLEPKTPPQPLTRVIAPEFRSYVVQQGDVSFESIAQRLFHDRKKWEVIARANPFVTSDRLKPGRTVLNIPIDPNNIQGKTITEDGQPVAETAEPTSPTARETTYVVQSDDTLWGIAKKVYGRGGAWRTIYDANRDAIKNPDRPPAGAVLTIPPAPPKE